MKHAPIITLLRRPRNLTVFLISAGVLFYLNFTLMARLPGSNSFMCVPGANVTPFNLFFSAVLSLLAGLVFAGLSELIAKKHAQASLAAGPVSLIGVTLGTLTVFCTFCILPVISLFGISLSLTFFTDYALWIKGLSLILLSVSVYVLNEQLAGHCVLGHCPQPTRPRKR